MNFALIEKELLCVKTLDEKAKKDFFKSLQNYELLFKSFAKVHNISHFTELETQIIDSLKVLDLKDLSFALKVLDIGSGAGFPALFLALLLKASFFLFEPNAKKASFLCLVKSELALENIFIHKHKIEEYKPQFKANLIISRAFMKSLPLIKLCKGFYDENSLFLLYKGSELENELQELNTNYEVLEFKKRKYAFIKAKGL